MRGDAMQIIALFATIITIVTTMMVEDDVEPLIPWPTHDCQRVTESCSDSLDEEDRCGHLCSQEECNLRIGIILPNSTEYIVNAPQALHELQLAEDHARRIGLLPNRLNVTYKIFDDSCTPAHATIGLVDAYSIFCAHAIFGPICDYCLANAARIVQYMGSYGKPLITPGGFSFDFVKPKTMCAEEYFMLINSGIADYQSLSEFFYLILVKYDWKQIALMYEKYDQNEVGGDQSCQLLMKSVIEVVKRHIPKVTYNDGDIWLKKVTYEEYLRHTIGNQFGVVVMCMSHANTRKVLIEAEKLGMFKRGEYVFLNFDMYTNGSQPWHDPEDDVANNERARIAYKSLLTFTPMVEAQIVENVNHTHLQTPGAAYLDGIYDGFILYLSAISEYLAAENWHNLSMRGINVVSNMFGKRFRGKRGKEIIMNCNGQRVADYALLQLSPIDDRLHIIANYSTFDKKLRFVRDIYWSTGKLPGDTPECGYDNEKCYGHVIFWILGSFLPILTALIFFGYRWYNKYMIELDLASDHWKINSRDLMHEDLPHEPRLSTRNSEYRFDGEKLSNVAQQPKCHVLIYNMNQVVVKEFRPSMKIEIGRAERLQLKKMKDLSHVSLVKFYGVCIEPENTCIVTEHCPRGSLLDVLQDEEIQLDTIFQQSLINDILLGMAYLHSNAIIHGSLKSTNCLIDAHFAVKISDFGLHFIRKHPKKNDFCVNDDDEYQKKIWTAPEFLRWKSDTLPSNDDLMKGDIYSFGIIVHEILFRKGPFYLRNDLKKKEIVERVKKGPDPAGFGEPLRPDFDESSETKAVSDLMKQCWAEDKDERPDFEKLKSTIREINRDNGNKGNLMDNLLNRMEMYANNLESLVMDRTNDFLTEKKKCEDLLYQLLPKSVASQLISGKSVIAETFDQVTICFSDIVEFTKLSAQSTPLEVVEMLNDLYTCFDEVIGDFSVYKVETIGDAYLVVSGLPERNGNRHASEIARMSLKLMETVKEFKIRHRPNDPLKLRIGMHTGSCVAGVVGLKMPRYCLFGDTVNTASRMESNGQPLRIHVSADTHRVLEASSPPSFELECRGEIDIKGKGKMTTYWLISEKLANPLPARNKTTLKFSPSTKSISNHSTSSSTSAPSTTTQKAITLAKTTTPIQTTAIAAAKPNQTPNGKHVVVDIKPKKQSEESVPLLRNQVNHPV